jgi:uncharacterized protein (DUF1800 family)
MCREEIFMAAPLSSNDPSLLAHLLRRTGFGWNAKDWKAASALGLDGLTQQRLHPETIPDNLAEVQQTIVGDFVDPDNLDSIRQWWVFRMVHSSRQLEEKMTLFWHQHFATANYKVNRPRWMWQQIETFRQHGLGNFRSLLLEVMRDPAMMVWLDGGANRKGQANENFARELMELFTMGVGNYTETDVKESARAFTGWVYDYPSQSYLFNPFQHDDGSKTFLGHTGNFQGEDIIDIIAHQPATAKFICTMLWKFFVNDTPTETDLKPLTQKYFQSGFEIRPVLETIFTSPQFYDPANRYVRVKNPTEFAAGIIKTLEAPVPRDVAHSIGNMGQELLNPPSVKGWDGGDSWINTNTLSARVNFASQMINVMNRRSDFRTQIENTYMSGDSQAAPPQAVQALWNNMLPGRALNDAVQTVLVDYVQGGADKTPPKVISGKLPGLVNLVLGSPDYQLA